MKPKETKASKPIRLGALARRLLRWYEECGRALPWRKTKDPYAILVSEIMLQQTQVSRVIPKYEAFLASFPNVAALARAAGSDVLTHWSGLGYNSRGLNLKKLAETVLREHGGNIPSDVEALRLLPGIGPYTAHAVASFAFGADVVAVDTNVKRVLGRVFGQPIDSETAFGVPKGQGASLNHALMDLGASMCGRIPSCSACPLRDICETQGRAPFEMQKKQTVPFRQSDRFVRGIVVRTLVKQGRCSWEEMLREVRKQAPEITDERFSAILEKLCRDGHIVAREDVLRLP